MKTAISIPDPVFRSAERAARRLKLSRSQLYAAAVTEYVERRKSAGVTAKLNQVYADTGAPVLDPVLAAAQFRSLRGKRW